MSGRLLGSRAPAPGGSGVTSRVVPRDCRRSRSGGFRPFRVVSPPPVLTGRCERSKAGRGTRAPGTGGWASRPYLTGGFAWCDRYRMTRYGAVSDPYRVATAPHFSGDTGSTNQRGKQADLERFRELQELPGPCRPGQKGRETPDRAGRLYARVRPRSGRGRQRVDLRPSNSRHGRHHVPAESAEHESTTPTRDEAAAINRVGKQRNEDEPAMPTGRRQQRSRQRTSGTSKLRTSRRQGRCDNAGDAQMRREIKKRRAGTSVRQMGQPSAGTHQAERNGGTRLAAEDPRKAGEGGEKRTARDHTGRRKSPNRREGVTTRTPTTV